MGGSRFGSNSTTFRYRIPVDPPHYFTMSKVKKMLDAVAGVVKGGGAIFAFEISDGGPDAKFVLDLKNGKGSGYIGTHDKPDVTITIAEADLQALADKKLDPMQAFMGGKIKVKGNMMLLM